MYDTWHCWYFSRQSSFGRTIQYYPFWPYLQNTSFSINTDCLIHPSHGQPSIPAVHPPSVQGWAADGNGARNPAHQPGQRGTAAEVAGCGGPAHIPLHGSPTTGTHTHTHMIACMHTLPHPHVGFSCLSLHGSPITGRHPHTHCWLLSPFSLWISCYRLNTHAPTCWLLSPFSSWISCHR